MWITASAGKETRLIMVDDVAYFRSDHKYTTVMTAQGESLLRTSLQELLGKLDPTHFKQIHRSTIVNVRMVAAIVRDESGRGTMRLKNRPETLQVSLDVHAAVQEHVDPISRSSSPPRPPWRAGSRRSRR